MSKQELEIRAKKVISKLKDMFGEGIEFECTDCFKTNETLTGISIQLPCPFAALVIYMEDMPEDASVDEIANICAVKLQEALRDIASGPDVHPQHNQRKHPGKCCPAGPEQETQPTASS